MFRICLNMRKRQKQSKQLDLGNALQFFQQLRTVIDELRRIKTEHNPKFKDIYNRKFLCLSYLAAIQVDRGYFSSTDMRFFFSGCDTQWYREYFLKLEKEGWLVRVEKDCKNRERKKLVGVLSPLSLSLMTLLRRRLQEVAVEISPDGQVERLNEAANHAFLGSNAEHEDKELNRVLAEQGRIQVLPSFIEDITDTRR